MRQMTEFFQLLYGTATDGWLCLWTMPDKRTHSFHVTELAKATALALELDAKGLDVYYGVGLRKSAPTSGRGRATDVLSIPGIWLDMDCRADEGPSGHAASALPTVDQAFSTVLSMAFQPTAIVHSGGGLHLYYLGHEQLKYPRADLIEAFQRQFIAPGSAHDKNGWHLDILANLAQVLRVPETHNHKLAVKRPVCLLSADGPRYETFPTPVVKFISLSPIADPSSLVVQPTPPRPPHDGNSPAPPEIDGSAVSFRDVMQALRKYRNKHKEIIQGIVDGEAFAAPGERDNALTRVCGILARLFPHATPEVLAQVLRISLLTMEAESPLSDPFNAVQMENKAVDLIARHQEKDAIKTEALTAIYQGAFGGVGAIPSGPVVRAEQDGKYSREELQAFADSQGCTLKEFEQRWIIQRKQLFYVFVNGAYERPIYREELANSLERRDLKRAPISWYTETKNGPKPRTVETVVQQHSTVARSVIIDFTKDKSEYNPKTQTFYEVPCPRRRVSPVYNKNIQTWLELLGGADKEKFLDWLATFSDLTLQTSALFLSGARGTGKTLLANGLAKFWTDGSPTLYEKIIDSFNADILKCPLIFADEGVASAFGGKATSSTLRRLIGSPGLTVSRKFVDNMCVNGNIRLILAANGADLLASIAEENLGTEDLEAISDRIFHITVSSDVRAYLEPRKSEIQGEWLNSDGIIKHVQWLTENRTVVHGKRFVVTGNAKHATLRRGVTMELVIEWIVRNLETPNQALQRQPNAMVIGKGEILVNTRWIVDNWLVHVPGQRVPRLVNVQKVLKSLSHRSINRGGFWYSSLDVDAVCDWIDQLQTGNGDKLRSLVNSPLQTTNGSLPC